LGVADSNDPITDFAANASDLWCATRNDEGFVGSANAMLLEMRVVGCFMVEWPMADGLCVSVWLPAILLLPAIHSLLSARRRTRYRYDTLT